MNTINTTPILLMVEGADRTGKSTFINRLRSKLLTPRQIYMHLSGPPKGMDFDQYTWSKRRYENLALSCKELLKLNDIVILDRTYLSEFVYAPLYRDLEYSLNMRQLAELNFLDELESLNENVRINPVVVLVYFRDKPANLLERDDGESFTTELDKKEEEIALFDEYVNASRIEHKIIVDWSETYFSYQTLDEVITKVFNISIGY